MLGLMGQVHRIFTCTEKKIGQFFKLRVLPTPKLDYALVVPTRPLSATKTPQGHQQHASRQVLPASNPPCMFILTCTRFVQCKPNL